MWIPYAFIDCELKELITFGKWCWEDLFSHRLTNPSEWHVIENINNLTNGAFISIVISYPLKLAKGVDALQVILFHTEAKEFDYEESYHCIPIWD